MITHVKYEDIIGQLTTEQVLDLIGNDRLDIQDIIGDIPLGYYRIGVNVKRDVNLDFNEVKTEDEIHELLMYDGGILMDYYGNLTDHAYNRLMNLVRGSEGEEWHFSRVTDRIIRQSIKDYPIELVLTNLPWEVEV